MKRIMAKSRIPAIEYMRGISMLGVVGIHVGSQYLSNPLPNTALVALFEIVTRFSVPIFFFISAFGLFYHLDIEKPFDYAAFLRRRAKTVLVPYIVWSVFLYAALHYAVSRHDVAASERFRKIFVFRIRQLSAVFYGDFALVLSIDAALDMDCTAHDD